jgi:hypothetical protein
MWGFWWLFPLMGIAFFIVLIVLLIRSFGGSNFPASRKEIDEMRGEIRELREEIERIKTQMS